MVYYTEIHAFQVNNEHVTKLYKNYVVYFTLFVKVAFLAMTNANAKSTKCEKVWND